MRVRMRVPQNRHYAHEHEPGFRHFCAPKKKSIQITQDIQFIVRPNLDQHSGVVLIFT